MPELSCPICECATNCTCSPKELSEVELLTKIKNLEDKIDYLEKELLSKEKWTQECAYCGKERGNGFMVCEEHLNDRRRNKQDSPNRA